MRQAAAGHRCQYLHVTFKGAPMRSYFRRQVPFGSALLGVSTTMSCSAETNRVYSVLYVSNSWLPRASV